MKTKIKSMATVASLFVAIASQAQWLVSGTNTYYNPLTYNVGIGTNAPQAKLQIQSGTVDNTPDNISALILTKKTSATTARHIFAIPHLAGAAMNPITATGDVGIFWSDGASSGGKNNSAGLVIAPWSNSKDGIRITAQGNVGIGTALNNNPNNYKLAVNGTIGAKAVKVEISSTTWADYVFDEKYTLKSINDLEAFVKKNKHLPNVPSAIEVGKNGIDLGTMDAILLEKIEELSLYIIEQNKRIIQQNKRIEILEKKY